MDKRCHVVQGSHMMASIWAFFVHIDRHSKPPHVTGAATQNLQSPAHACAPCSPPTTDYSDMTERFSLVTGLGMEFNCHTCSRGKL